MDDVRTTQRLGLRRTDKDDESKLGRPLLTIMEDHKLDFHGTFRRLCFFTSSTAASEDDGEDLRAFIDSLLKLTSEPERLDRVKAQSDWSGWLSKYAARIESERGLWEADGVDVDIDTRREKEAKAANPRFVLRQWVLEEVIKKVEADAESGKRILRKVLHVRYLCDLVWTVCAHDVAI